jgi:hypothetical protein
MLYEGYDYGDNPENDRLIFITKNISKICLYFIGCSITILGFPWALTCSLVVDSGVLKDGTAILP